MIRVLFTSLIFICGLSSCGSASSFRASPTNINVKIQLAKGEQIESGYLISVAIRNKTQQKICLSNDILKNASSAAPFFKLKNSQGVEQPEFKRGFVPPPLPGSQELAPDALVKFQYDLTNYFDVSRDWFFEQDSFYLLAKVPFDFCDNRPMQLADSGLQKL